MRNRAERDRKHSKRGKRAAAGLAAADLSAAELTSLVCRCLGGANGGIEQRLTDRDESATLAGDASGMSPPTFAESVFFADLTRTLMRLKDAPLAKVEETVEEHFRDFVRQREPGSARSLAITFTWTLPEGADGWAEYGTEYRTGPVATPAATIEALSPTPLPSPRQEANVIPFRKRAAAR